MKYVIVGGDAAGMSAAMEIYRHDKEAQITTLDKGQHYSYGQCGLPYVLDGRVPNAEDVVHKTAAQFNEKYGIDARTGYCVTKVDCIARVVYGYKTDTNEPFEETYDRLLIATGAEPKKATKMSRHHTEQCCNQVQKQPQRNLCRFHRHKSEIQNKNDDFIGVSFL